MTICLIFHRASPLQLWLGHKLAIMEDFSTLSLVEMCGQENERRSLQKGYSKLETEHCTVKYKVCVTSLSLLFQWGALLKSPLQWNAHAVECQDIGLKWTNFTTVTWRMSWYASVDNAVCVCDSKEKEPNYPHKFLHRLTTPSGMHATTHPELESWCCSHAVAKLKHQRWTL